MNSGRQAGDDTLGVIEAMATIWSLAFFWGVAVLLVPEYPATRASELMPAGIAFSAAFLAPVLLSALRSPENLLKPLSIFFVGVFFWVILDLAQGSYALPNVPATAIVSSFNAIGIFGIALVTGNALSQCLTVGFRSHFNLSADTRGIFLAICACFVLGVMQAMVSCHFSPVCFAEGLLAPRFQATWQYSDIGHLDTLLFNFKLMGMVLPSLAVLLVKLEERISWRVVAAVVMVGAYLLLIIQDGDRRYVGLMLLAGVLTGALLYRPIRWKQVAVMGGVVALLVLLLNSIVLIRDTGWGALFKGAVEEREYNKAPLVKVDTNFRFLAQIIDIVPERHPYTGLAGIYANLAAPVPRSILPDKPMLHAFPLRWYIPGLPRERDWSWTCSAVCDFYLIGGNWAVLVGGLLFGFFANICYRRYRANPCGAGAVKYSLIIMSLFVGLRAIREVAILGLVMGMLWLLFACGSYFYWNSKDEYSKSKS